MRRSGILFLVFLVSVLWAGCKGEPGAPEKAEVRKAAGAGGSAVAEGEAGKPQSTESGRGAAGTPKIVFDRMEYDFGEVEAGEKVEHLFSFRNTGDAPLKIERVRSA